MLRFLTIIVRNLFVRVEGFWKRKTQDDEWDEFLLGRYQEEKQTYRWRDKQAEKEDKLKAKGEEYRRHQLPDEDIKTEIIKPLSPKQRRQIRLRVSRRTLFSMVGMTVVVAAVYLFWFQISIFFLNLALGGECGYRGRLLEVRKQCKCGGKYFEVGSFLDRRGYCFGGCYDCECWQLQVGGTTGPDGPAPVELRVDCPPR